MIIGEVTPDREAVVTIGVSRKGEPYLMVDAVLDTGFTDALTLPLQTITALSLAYETNVEVMLGDGTIVLSNVYQATVLWNGENRTISVHEAETDSLAGMALLYGLHLGMDVVDGGAVTLDSI